MLIVSVFSAPGAATVTLLFASFTTVYPVVYVEQFVISAPLLVCGSDGNAGIYVVRRSEQIFAPALLIVAAVVVIPVGSTPLLSAAYAPIALRI